MSIKLKPLSDQTVVITGASSGIGLATARLVAQQGAAVVMVARNEEALSKAAEDIREQGGRAAICAADVSDYSYPEKVGAVARQEFGGFDSWVNDAAAAVYARLEEVSEDEHRQVFDTGYFGTVAGSLYAAKVLRERGGGAIVNVGSVLGDRAILVQGAYSAMKHAVHGFTEALRMELQDEETGISLTLIKPNGIDTPYPEHARNKMAKPARIPPVVYDPQLVAKAIAFACAHPKRDLLVGGQGYMITKFGNIFPGVTDRMMETFFDEKAQSTDTPAEPGARDNLFEAKKDGRVHSNQDNAVRKTSLALNAQMHPGLAAVAGLATVAIGGLIGAAVSRRR